MKPSLLAALVVGWSLVSSASVPLVYRFEWRSFASRTVWTGGEPITTRGDLTGNGTATLQPAGPAGFRLTFSGPEGSGAASVGPGVPRDVVFPVAVAVGVPPPPPHLIAGWFTVQGDPRQPDGFEIVYTEGFICRTTPDRCGGVTTWERSFTGHAFRDESAARESAP